MGDNEPAEADGHGCALCGHDETAVKPRARAKWTDSILRNFSVLIVLGLLVGVHAFLVSIGAEGLSVASSETPWVLALGGLLGNDMAANNNNGN